MYLTHLMRRANLDLFWSREKSTITHQYNKVKEIIQRDIRWSLPLSKLFPPLKCHPVEVDSGMGVAMMMLEKSREKGRNADYTQFGTIRQLRTTYSNIYGGSVEVRVENGV
jgi:hypothetical protein